MIRRVLLFLLAGISFLACKKEIEKFQRPEWLEGKLYTQIKTIPDVESFTQCLEITGYDTIIDRSGSYTVFVPNDAAFEEYFASHPQYNSVLDMSYEDMKELVKYHIVQNPWSRYQLMTLDINGWIDKEDPYNDEPWGYKRQTLLKEENRKYFVKIDGRDLITIVDSTQSNDTRTVFNPSRKYVPIFFDEYMYLARLNASDFEFYFDRPFESGNIYFANALLLDQDAYAENGFIYVVDEVVDPFKNVEKLLEDNSSGNTYTQYISSVHLFPQFVENIEETNKQPGAEEGLDVPDLYDLSYPQLTFDIQKELTGKGRDGVNSTNTIRYHYGMVAPTDVAMKDLIDNLITDKSGYPHWPSYQYAPDIIKRIVVNTHMAESPVYLSDIREGFINGEKDSVAIDEGVIVEKHFGSNATFIGVNKPIIPRAFSSVAGPVYLRPGFRRIMYSMEFANILPAVKRREATYSFYVQPDWSLLADSSLYISPDLLRPGRYIVESYDMSTRPARKVSRSEYEINYQMLNQIGTGVHTGIPRKEFIPTLAGNYIVYNSTDDIVTGGVPSKRGYNGTDSTIYLRPQKLEEPTDNGITYQVEGWFSFPRVRIYDLLSGGFPDFFAIIQRAGLTNYDYGILTFINDSEYYTVFVPSGEALDNYATDTMSVEELQQFVKYHFVSGEHIFTDGKKPAGNYETKRKDESSTVYNTVYSKLDIRPGVDHIQLYDTEGGLIYSIEESESATNIMTGVDLNANNNNTNVTNYITNSVIHLIDTVLIKR